MIVGVESNFVLELALEQTDADPASRIVELAEKHRIHLVVPACALTEPYETLVRRSKDRRQLVDRLRNETKQLARTKRFAGMEKASAEVANALGASIGHHARELERTIRRLCACGTVVAVTPEVLAEALDAQRRFKLGPQDAFVFASIDLYLRRAAKGPKYFINKNSHDFLTDRIRQRLGSYDCELMIDFAKACNRIEAQLVQ
jgi:predicted nucleic acid-binding protein